MKSNLRGSALPGSGRSYSPIQFFRIKSRPESLAPTGDKSYKNGTSHSISNFYTRLMLQTSD